MNEILSWLAWGLGTLVVVAMVVAGWEHLVREARGQRRLHRVAARQTPARALSVDVRLDTQAATLAPDPAEPAAAPNDRESRLAAMTEALSRAADPKRVPQDRGRWLDTTPRVVNLDEPALGPRDRQREKGSSPQG